jgi:hypothetical protein
MPVSVCLNVEWRKKILFYSLLFYSILFYSRVIFTTRTKAVITCERCLHHLRQMIRQMPVGHPLQVVIVRILRHPSVDIRPGEVIHRVLLVFNRLRHNLRVEMVMEAVVKMGLDGQRLVEELLEKVLLGVLAEKDALGVRVLGGTVGPAHHLQDVRDGIVVVGVQLPVVVLCVHDHHCKIKNKLMKASRKSC